MYTILMVVVILIWEIGYLFFQKEIRYNLVDYDETIKRYSNGRMVYAFILDLLICILLFLLTPIYIFIELYFFCLYQFDTFNLKRKYKMKIKEFCKDNNYKLVKLDINVHRGGEK